MLRFLCVALIALAAAMYFGVGGLSLPAPIQSGINQARNYLAPKETTAVYRWTDAQGRIHYGTTPPSGVRAELATGGSVNTIAMPKAAPAKASAPAAANPADEGKSIRDMAVDRAIEGSTR